MQLTPDEVLRHALAGDHRTLRRRCAEVLADGASPAAVVGECLAPAQAAVGERWLRNELSVGDEHRATAVVDAALAGLELDQLRSGGPKVVTVCAEGEWHAIAVRMLSVAVAEAGADPVCLGPSLPARDLGTTVRELGAVGVLLSCSSVAALPGAARCVERLAELDIPVAVGGHATRAVPQAGEALGCAVFEDPSEAVRALPTLRPAPRHGAAAAAAVGALDVAAERLLVITAQRLARSADADLSEPVGYLLGFARAALQLGDPAVVEAHRDWLDTFLAARSVPTRFEHLVAAAQEAAGILDDPRPFRAALGA
jgi:methanogenic corrinoid protein MtbC1